MEEAPVDKFVLLGRRGGITQRGIGYVLSSLTRNSRLILKELCDYQIANSGKSGLPFSDYFRICKEKFLVLTDLSLRTQLTDLRDHQLVRTKKIGGVEFFFTPFPKESLAHIESLG